VPLSGEKKTGVIEAHRKHGTDTGSPEVQVALLSTRIDDLQGHFDRHAKDHHSRQGLLRMVGRRRRLLDYLRGKNPSRYQDLIARLGIRK
jgi:small subunit ribosomal protein S15